MSSSYTAGLFYGFPEPSSETYEALVASATDEPGDPFRVSEWEDSNIDDWVGGTYKHISTSGFGLIGFFVVKLQDFTRARDQFKPVDLTSTLAQVPASQEHREVVDAAHRLGVPLTEIKYFIIGDDVC